MSYHFQDAHKKDIFGVGVRSVKKNIRGYNRDGERE